MRSPKTRTDGSPLEQHVKIPFKGRFFAKRPMLSTQNKTCRATPVSKPVRQPRGAPWTRPAGRAQDPPLPRAMHGERAIQAHDKPHCMTGTMLPRQAMSAELTKMPSHPGESLHTCGRRMCINHIQRPNTYFMYAQLSFKCSNVDKKKVLSKNERCDQHSWKRRKLCSTRGPFGTCRLISGLAAGRLAH